mmetsp:Transcript_96971/g.222121  ORF Transcript_96971/g.222121 Transcript_96971/m.222121 type:complete len:260 (-) Transcript_96971:96-875(-)
MRRSRSFTSFRAAQTVSKISRSSGNSSNVDTRSSRDAMAQMHTVLQRIVAFLRRSTPSAAISPTTVAACRSITCCPPCSTDTHPRDSTYMSVPVSPWRMIVSSGMKVFVTMRSASLSQKARWHFSNRGSLWSITVLTSSSRSCTQRSRRCCSPGYRVRMEMKSSLRMLMVIQFSAALTVAVLLAATPSTAISPNRSPTDTSLTCSPATKTVALPTNKMCMSRPSPPSLNIGLPPRKTCRRWHICSTISVMQPTSMPRKK